MKKKAAEYASQLESLPVGEALLWICDEFPGKVVFTTSLGAEDQTLTHMIYESKAPVTIITLDTGRLFPETYELLDITEKKYGLGIKVYFPRTDSVERMVREKGINLFYDSIDNRKLCCYNRKVEPLKRALQGAQAWITGLRKGQSDTRSNIPLCEWDASYEVFKLNPLAGWTDDQLWSYIRKFKVPYNPLHDRGYPSLGCQPCTRALLEGEHPRAGRWWWENDSSRECGLHKK